MRILSLDAEPFASLDYANAGHDGRAYRANLPILRGTVDRLPDGVEGLAVTGDLQGRSVEALSGETTPLLGEILPDHLESLFRDHGLPGCDRCGAILAGDLYTVPRSNKRGGTGDVLPVWQAFGAAFHWVLGVLGNHDLAGTGTVPPGWMRRSPSVRLVLQGVESRGGIAFGALSGIIGNPRRPNGFTEEEYVAKLMDILSGQPEVLVLHDGPDVPETDLRGRASIREALELAPADRPSLVIRAHCYWPTPLVELQGGR